MLEGCPGLSLLREPPGYKHSYYLHTMLVSREWAGDKRDRLVARLGQEYGVNCEVLDRPVHRTIPFITAHTRGQELPVSEELGDRLFCTPIHPCMSEEDNGYIATEIWDAAERTGKEG